MDITYYDKSVTFLLIASLLWIFVFCFSLVIDALYLECYYRASKISTIVAIAMFIAGIILFCLHGYYGKEYRKQAYEQCRSYMKEQYHVEIVEYQQKDSVYIRGRYVEIKTYFYSNANKNYVEYECQVLNNGIIQYQRANIW